jgi:hypothetical protein
VSFDECRESLFKDSQVTHPVTNERLDCVVDEGERLYFDSGSGQWATMPVSLELLVPEVQAAIRRIQAQVAGWKSSREIVLALRAHGYNLQLVVEERQYEEDAGLVHASTHVDDDKTQNQVNLQDSLMVVRALIVHRAMPRCESFRTCYAWLVLRSTI